MRPSSERARVALVALLLAASCGDETKQAANRADDATVAASDADTERAGARDGGGSAPAADAASAAQAGITGRTRELVNPEPETVVMLYHDLSGLALPFERLVGEDSRVSMARAIDKQAQRELVRAELEAALASVRDVGALRISMSANLSDYDPSYEEFTVRALAPSSVVTFDAFREHVELRFTNGLAAQTWKVPAAEAQLVRDKVGQFQNASLNVLVRITGVEPKPGGGGTIVTEIIEYELRAEPSGERLTQVRVGE